MSFSLDKPPRLWEALVYAFLTIGKVITCMAKPKVRFPFLVGLTRQLREAWDEGLEEAYEFAELMDELLNEALDSSPLDVESDEPESRLESALGPQGPTPRSGVPDSPPSGIPMPLASMVREERPPAGTAPVARPLGHHEVPESERLRRGLLGRTVRRGSRRGG